MCDVHKVHEDGMDNLSRYGREEWNGHVGFTVEYTGTGRAVMGQKVVPVAPHELKKG